MVRSDNDFMIFSELGKQVKAGMTELVMGFIFYRQILAEMVV